MAKIQRMRYCIVKNGNEIMCGKKCHLRFIPFDKVTSRENIVMYESVKKAQAAINNSWYMDKKVDTNGGEIMIVSFQETLESWIV